MRRAKDQAGASDDYATLLLAQGEQPRTIMDILDHSLVSLTMNTHAHVMPSLRRETADKVDAVLGMRNL